MRVYTQVHELDRRDLLRWGVDVKDKAFLEDYNVERNFWEAGGQFKGGMPQAILYLLAKKHVIAKSAAETKEVGKTKKEPQPA